MEFIKAEEFLKQPVEVQQTLINWANLNVNDYDLVQMNGEIMLYIDFKNRDDEFLSCDSLPLLVEGQLRQFIEDKTGNKTDCCLDANTYDINICEDTGFYIKKYEDIDSDLLQAYWKVAIEIAKEETHE